MSARTRHNPLIFAGLPSEQLSLGRPNGSIFALEEATTSLLEKSKGMIHEQPLATMISEFVDPLIAERALREEQAALADSLYSHLENILRAEGIFEQVQAAYDRSPIAPAFYLPEGEWGPDDAHRSKVGGIPDLRGDFLFTHRAVMKKAAAERGDSLKTLPEWAHMSDEDAIKKIWPKDPNGGYMQFAAQVWMPAACWELLILSGARRVSDRYQPDEHHLDTPLGIWPPVYAFGKGIAHVYHSRDFTFSSQCTACVDFTDPCGEGAMPWPDYVELVKRAIPEFVYSGEENEYHGPTFCYRCTSAPLADPALAMEIDLGDDRDPECGYHAFVESLGDRDVWDFRHLMAGGRLDGQRGVTVGGRPSSQQEEKRPWDPMAGGSPSRMIPFVCYDDNEHDVTHQIYISGFRENGSGAYWGIDDESCT